MAENTLVLTFNYENDAEFKLKANANDAGDVTIVEMEENGNLGRMFDKGLKNSLMDYFEVQLDAMIASMKE